MSPECVCVFVVMTAVRPCLLIICTPRLFIYNLCVFSFFLLDVGDGFPTCNHTDVENVAPEANTSNNALLCNHAERHHINGRLRSEPAFQHRRHGWR